MLYSLTDLSAGYRDCIFRTTFGQNFSVPRSRVSVLPAVHILCIRMILAYRIIRVALGSGEYCTKREEINSLILILTDFLAKWLVAWFHRSTKRERERESNNRRAYYSVGYVSHTTQPLYACVYASITWHGISRASHPSRDRIAPVRG